MTKSESQKQFYPQLNQSDLEEIKNIQQNPNASVLAVKHDFIQQNLTFRNLQTLKDATWLNDEVINAYVTLIQRKAGEKVVITNSFFLDLVQNYINKDETSKLMRMLKRYKVII